MRSSLRLTFFKQQRANRPAISLPCSSFQIGASRSLRIAAPLCFGSGSVRSIHDRSWSALLAPSSVVSSCSSDLQVLVAKWILVEILLLRGYSPRMLIAISCPQRSIRGPLLASLVHAALTFLSAGHYN